LYWTCHKILAKFRDCEYWCTEDVELEIGCYNCRLTCSVSHGCCYHQISFLLIRSCNPYYIPYTLKNTTTQFNYKYCITVLFQCNSLNIIFNSFFFCINWNYLMSLYSAINLSLKCHVWKKTYQVVWKGKINILYTQITWLLTLLDRYKEFN
jgi:hypothetical protein